MNTEPGPDSPLSAPPAEITPGKEGLSANRRRVSVGRLGLIFSCIALVTICLMFLLRPG